MALDEEDPAASLFAEADANGNGALDGEELMPVVSKLAEAAGCRPSAWVVASEVAVCLKEFASQVGGVTLSDFRQYAASKPDLFGPLYQWRKLFSKYSSPGGTDNGEINL